MPGWRRLSPCHWSRRSARKESAFVDCPARQGACEPVRARTSGAADPASKTVQAPSHSVVRALRRKTWDCFEYRRGKVRFPFQHSAEPALCMNGAANRLDSCTRGRGFHKRRLRFTAYFAAHVQDVESPGRVEGDSGTFSKCPDLHSLILENWTPVEGAGHEGVEMLFHFSCRNYGGYCLCFYLLSESLTPVALCSLVGWNWTESASAAGAGESRKRTGFPLESIVNKVNTIKRNPGRTFPRGRKLL